jgi:hypothetical protein
MPERGNVFSIRQMRVPRDQIAEGEIWVAVDLFFKCAWLKPEDIGRYFHKPF